MHGDHPQRDPSTCPRPTDASSPPSPPWPLVTGGLRLVRGSWGTNWEDRGGGAAGMCPLLRLLLQTAGDRRALSERGGRRSKSFRALKRRAAALRPHACDVSFAQFVPSKMTGLGEAGEPRNNPAGSQRVGGRGPRAPAPGFTLQGVKTRLGHLGHNRPSVPWGPPWMTASGPWLFHPWEISVPFPCPQPALPVPRSGILCLPLGG